MAVVPLFQYSRVYTMTIVFYDYDLVKNTRTNMQNEIEDNLKVHVDNDDLDSVVDSLNKYITTE